MSPKKRALLILPALGVLILAACKPGVGAADPMAGQGAPLFSLKLFDGKELKLEELRGKAVVINFWASRCGPCREEAPGLERTWRVYKDKGVVFVGVDMQDREEDARAYMKEFDITYPNGPDNSGEITVAYRVTAIPTTFFINREGKIVRRYMGAIKEQLLASYIEDLLK